MKLEEVLAQLESLGNEKVRERYRRNGASDALFGVQLGDLRKLAARIKSDHPLALALWDTGIVDARLLAILLLQPKKLSREEMERMLRSIDFAQVADWFNVYVAKHHPDRDALREKWIGDEHPWAARAGWSLTAERIAGQPAGLELPALLDRLEAEMADAAPEVQWTMNFCLAGIGIHCPEHRQRAIAIGEKLGLYRDYPVAKGCTSPFAPIWIEEMVSRSKRDLR